MSSAAGGQGGAPPARRGGAVALLVATVLLVAAAAAAEVTLDVAGPRRAERLPVAEPTSGTWYCPVTAGEQETAVLSIAAAGDEPSTVTVVRYGEQGPVADPAVEVPVGGQHEVVLSDGQAARPTTVRWRGGPAVTTWRVEGDDSAGAPCETAPAPTWHLTGFDTTARSQASLHLFNAFGVDAVAKVTFGTPEGRVDLVLTHNILVPARSSMRLSLNEYQPEQSDLATTVEVLTGRLVVQGATSLQPTPNRPGPSGRDVVPGTPEPAVDWAFAYGRADQSSSSWLSLFNPTEREAAVEVLVSEPLPDAVELGELSLPAGGVVRLDLGEVSAATEFGIAVTGVNDVPFVATRLSAVRTAEGAEGLAASTGVATAEQWLLAGGGGGDRRGRVSLYNPGTDDVTVDVDAGQGTPAEWAGIVLPANGHVALELADAGPDRPQVPVRISGDGPFVTDLRSQSPGSRPRYWTAAGVPAAAWRGSGSRPPVRHDPLLDSAAPLARP